MPTETAVERETFQTSFALKDSKLEEGEFQGFASVFNHEVDAFIPTIVEPGAFKKTIRERGDRIKILWQHDRSEPIGFPIGLKETEEGLFIHGKISDTARGRDALALMRDGHKLGKTLELSIGFEPIRWSTEKRKGSKDEEVRRLQEVRLNEISFVTLAADTKAQVTEVNRLAEDDETFAITDEDKSALQAEIRKLNMKDLVATHRRLHQFAARGNLLTGFSRSDMSWFHAQVEAELKRRAKADGRTPPAATPLQWGSTKQSAADELDLVEVDPTDDDLLHFPSRVKKIAEREKKKKGKGHGLNPEQEAMAEDTLEELFQAGFVIQTVVFPKRAWTEAKAREWLKAHKDSSTAKAFRADKVDTTDNSYRFRQRDPVGFARIRPKCLTPAGAAPNLERCRILVFGGPLKERREDEPKHRITLGEFLSPILDEMAELPLEVEHAGDADDVTSPRLADFDRDELFSEESFAGRVLSKDNRKKIAQALTILRQLLDAAEPPDDEKKALEHVNEQWMDAELERARAQLNRLNGG